MNANITASLRAAHIVLDLETLSTQPNAAVIAIGAVALDAKGEFVSEFHTAVNAKSQPLRSVDSDTIAWWSKQSVEAQAASLNATDAKTATHAMCLFSDWMEKHADSKSVKVWGNGCSLDNVILGSLYAQCHELGFSQPWSWRNDRDMRTVLDLLPDAKNVGQFEGIKHHALHDARHEAKQLGKALHQAAMCLHQITEPATDRDTHFYLAGWNGARENVDANEHFQSARQAASPAQTDSEMVESMMGALHERDEAEEFVDKVLDLVLGLDRHEWSSAYDRADALADVEEKMAAPPAQAAGMKAAADLVQEQADLYITEHAETDPDTGSVIWHHRDYGFDWHNGLEELAQKLRARAALAAAPAQQDAREYWAVLSPSGQGAIFDDEDDARWTHTGEGHGSGGVGFPTIGGNFRDCYDDDAEGGTLELVRVQVIAARAAQGGDKP